MRALADALPDAIADGDGLGDLDARDAAAGRKAVLELRQKLSQLDFALCRSAAESRPG